MLVIPLIHLCTRYAKRNLHFVVPTVTMHISYYPIHHAAMLEYIQVCPCMLFSIFQESTLSGSYGNHVCYLITPFCSITDRLNYKLALGECSSYVRPIACSSKQAQLWSFSSYNFKIQLHSTLCGHFQSPLMCYADPDISVCVPMLSTLLIQP